MVRRLLNTVTALVVLMLLTAASPKSPEENLSKPDSYAKVCESLSALPVALRQSRFNLVCGHITVLASECMRLSRLVCIVKADGHDIDAEPALIQELQEVTASREALEDSLVRELNALRSLYQKELGIHMRIASDAGFISTSDQRSLQMTVAKNMGDTRLERGNRREQYQSPANADVEKWIAVARGRSERGRASTVNSRPSTISDEHGERSRDSNVEE